MVKLLNKLDMSSFDRTLSDSTYLLNLDKEFIKSVMDNISILDIDSFDEANIYEHKGRIFWIDKEGIIDYITELINK